MDSSSDLAIILSPLIKQCQPRSLLLAGDVAINSCQDWHATSSHLLELPFSIQQLADLPKIDLAIVSGITETLPKSQALEWLGYMRNAHAQRIIVISEISPSIHPAWQITDYLGLGMKRLATINNYQLFTYAIENYQLKRDWLNNRFWANPENFDKYRW